MIFFRGENFMNSSAEGFESVQGFLGEELLYDPRGLGWRIKKPSHRLLRETKNRCKRYFIKTKYIRRASWNCRVLRVT
jgi:hypothetical protein